MSVNTPRFAINPPQLHHQNTTFKTHIFAKHSAKTPFSPQQKKLILLFPQSCGTLLSKAKRKRKLFYI
jgi:hypothetical protein